MPRLVGLKGLRLTPRGVNPLVYAMGARYLGRTDEEIIIALLARRVKELNEVHDYLKEIHFGKNSGTEKADQPQEATASEPRKQEPKVDSITEKTKYANFLDN